MSDSCCVLHVAVRFRLLCYRSELSNLISTRMVLLNYYSAPLRQHLQGNSTMAFSRLSRSCETWCRELGADTKLEKIALKMKDEKAHLQRTWVLFSVGRTQTFAFKPNLIMHSSDLHFSKLLHSLPSWIPCFPILLEVFLWHPLPLGWKSKCYQVIMDETSRSWMFGKQPNVSLINSNIFNFDWPFQTESEKHWGWKQPLEII